MSDSEHDLENVVYEENSPANYDDDDRRRSAEENDDERDRGADNDRSANKDNKEGSDSRDRDRRRGGGDTVDKVERKRTPQFLLTHNPDLDLGCDCLQLIQAYGSNRTKSNPKWNVDRKDQEFRADLDVCIRGSSDVILVRGEWKDSERNAKRSAALQGCKRLIERGELRNLMRLAHMIGAWVFIGDYGDDSEDVQTAKKIVSEAKVLVEKGEFKRGGERTSAPAVVDVDGRKIVARKNAWEIVDQVFDQVWGEKKFIRNQPIYEVETNKFRVVATIPKLIGTFDEDTAVKSDVCDTIQDARRSLGWEIACLLHPRGKLPNHILDENYPIQDIAPGDKSGRAIRREERRNRRGGSGNDDRRADDRRQPERNVVSYTSADRDRERAAEKSSDRRIDDRRTDGRRNDDRRNADRRNDVREQRERISASRPRSRSPARNSGISNRYDDADFRSDRTTGRRDRSPVDRDVKRKDRGDDYASDPKRRKL